MTLADLPIRLNQLQHLGRMDWWLNTNSYTDCIVMVQSGWGKGAIVLHYLEAARIAGGQ